MNLSPLKPALLSLLLLWQTSPQSTDSTAHLRYRRALTLDSKPSTTPSDGQACAVLDAAVFAHASASLKDLRLYRGRTEVPYAVTLSESVQQESEDARVLNLAARSGHIAFDLEMPHRPYTTVALDLAARDFIATATVTGSAFPNAKDPARLGTFTLFDLTSQRLSHGTSLPLAESSLPYLHIELALTPAPGNHTPAGDLNRPAVVRGATVPPNREAQTVYTTLAQTSNISQRGEQSIAVFQVPVRVPVERVSFVLAPGYKGNFSRSVQVGAEVQPGSPPDASGEDDSEAPADDQNAPQYESITGSILRVHQHRSSSDLSPDISAETLSVPAAIGSNMQHPARIEVAVDNGHDAPLPIAAVELQMRQRRICFDPASATGPLTLYYGDRSLDAPVYDNAKLSEAAADPRVALLGPEVLNPEFVARSETRTFRQRHPEVLWIVLLGAVCLVALLLIRSSKKHAH